MRNFLFCCILLLSELFFANGVLAVDPDYASVTQNINFGSFTQTAEKATFELGYDGTAGLTGGTASGYNAGMVEYKIGDGALGHTITMPTDLTVTNSASNCNLSLTLSFNPLSFTIRAIFGTSSQSVSVGAKLEISGFCKAGTYSSSFTISPTADWGYNVESATMTFSVTFKDKIGITGTQDMNFGTMMSPATDSTVTLSYNGSRTSTGSIYLINGETVSQGIFTVEGVSGREVTVILPTTINLGYTGLDVSAFVADKGDSFTLSSETEKINIGATLKIPANIPEGIYSGDYTVQVSY